MEDAERKSTRVHRGAHRGNPGSRYYQLPMSVGRAYHTRGVVVRPDRRLGGVANIDITRVNTASSAGNLHAAGRATVLTADWFGGICGHADLLFRVTGLTSGVDVKQGQGL